MGPLPPQIKPAANAGQRCHACSAERPVVLNCRGIAREVPAQLSVRQKESGRHAAQGHKPRGIGKADPRRTRPDLFLIVKEILPNPLPGLWRSLACGLGWGGILCFSGWLRDLLIASRT